MSVSTGDVVAQIFTTANPTTGAAQDADSLPTGVLWVDGVADAATVTITDATGTGRYTFSATMPTLTTGQRVSVVVAATIATIACAGEVWSDQCAPSANVTQWKGATAPDASTFANAGTYSYSNTVDDGSGNLIDGAYVELATDSAMTNVVNATHTNSLGAFTVYSDTAGTHYLRITIGGYEVGTATVTTA